MHNPTDEADHPLAHLLYRKIFTTKLGAGHFLVQYADDVDEAGFKQDDVQDTIEFDDDTGHMTVFAMPFGIAVAHFVASDDGEERWAAFETKARIEGREHLSRWATFARGSWSKRCPDQPGLYMAAPKDSAVAAATPFPVFVDFTLRRMQKIDGVVRDVTTHCPATHRTEWQGYWWTEPVPMMLAPTRDP